MSDFLGAGGLLAGADAVEPVCVVVVFANVYGAGAHFHFVEDFFGAAGDGAAGGHGG